VLATAPILKRKLADDVRDRLTDLIARDRLQPGDPLPSERALMEALSVGRPAIREAMQALHRAGLIEVRHGERTRVAQPSIGRMFDQLAQTMHHMLLHSPASLENLKDARLTFEMQMARLAAGRCTPDDAAQLDRVIDAQEAARDDMASFRRLDGVFHRELAAISGNPIWAALSDALFSWLKDFHSTLVSAPGSEVVTIAEHRQIIAAVRAGQVEQAAMAMADHLNRANDLYRARPVPQ
jgi:GntR family transcriptional regulator, sialic acid-inducible nan operon repressor